VILQRARATGYNVISKEDLAVSKIDVDRDGARALKRAFFAERDQALPIELR
jgi:hypothetical protein